MGNHSAPSAAILDPLRRAESEPGHVGAIRVETNGPFANVLHDDAQRHGTARTKGTGVWFPRHTKIDQNFGRSCAP